MEELYCSRLDIFGGHNRLEIGRCCIQIQFDRRKICRRVAWGRSCQNIRWRAIYQHSCSVGAIVFSCATATAAAVLFIAAQARRQTRLSSIMLCYHMFKKFIFCTCKRAHKSVDAPLLCQDAIMISLTLRPASDFMQRIHWITTQRYNTTCGPMWSFWSCCLPIFVEKVLWNRCFDSDFNDSLCWVPLWTAGIKRSKIQFRRRINNIISCCK